MSSNLNKPPVKFHLRSAVQRQEGWEDFFSELVGLQLYLLQFLVGPGLVPLCQVGHTQEPVCLCHLRTEITEHCHFGLQGLSED